MSYFDAHPQLFRIIYGSVAVCLLVIASISVFQFGKSPTDENIFQDPPSPAYVIRAFPAERVESTAKYVEDSIQVADLLISVDAKRPKSVKEGFAYINSLPDTASLVFELLRPTEQKKYTYRTRKSSVIADNVKELQPTALVVDVTPGGASDRAGLLIGDHITRINGQTFSHVGKADSILRQGQIGKTIDYEVLRNNKVITLHVTLASFGLQFGFLFFILTGLCYISTGIFMAMARPQFSAMRLLGWFFLAAGYFMVESILNRGIEAGWLLTLQRWTLALSVVTAFPVMLHSLHYFPIDRPDLLKRKWIRIGGYLMALLILISPAVLPVGWRLLMIAVLGLYTLLIPIPYRKGAPVEYRRLNRLVRWTGALIGVGAIAFGIATQAGGSLLALRLISWFGLLLLTFPAAYLYTIGRYRLFNLALRVRRSVQYSFVSIALLVTTILISMIVLSFLVQSDFHIPYVRITSSSIEITDTPTSQAEQTAIARAVLAALAIGATFTILRLHKAGGKFLSQKFHRAQYDYRRAANELAEVLSTTLNMTHLARGIVEKLASLMQLKRVGVLFFRDQKVCCCHEAHGFDGTTWDTFCVSIDNNMVSGLKGFTREVSVNSLPAGVKDAFKAQEFHYIVPIRSKEKLVGTLLIGEKMSESAFKPEDMEFLGSVAKQASVAIENAFLYEELAEQERMKHELAIARRIQLESLPQSTPDIGGLEISGISIPALEVGGDFFDYLDGSPSKLTVIVGDVSGKGTSAALYMSKVQGILRSLHGFGLAPRELFIRANHLLCRDLEKRSFITAMGAAFDPGQKQLVLARAGHLPLFHYKAAAKRVETITPKGLGLGLSPENLFANELEERRVSYSVGDVFVFVTDGITEGQRRTGDEYGEDRLLQLLEATSLAHADVIRDRVIDEVKAFAGDADQHDDQTVVVVKIT